MISCSEHHRRRLLLIALRQPPSIARLRLRQALSQRTMRPNKISRKALVKVQFQGLLRLRRRPISPHRETMLIRLPYRMLSNLPASSGTANAQRQLVLRPHWLRGHHARCPDTSPQLAQSQLVSSEQPIAFHRQARVARYNLAATSRGPSLSVLSFSEL
jgi:hypothetical protein